MPTLAIHGGAGTMPAGALDAAMADLHHRALRQALAQGWAVLARGGAALDAVCEAVISLENDPLFNAGCGSVFNEAGALEMDAAVAEGCRRRAGAVAGICGPKNPVLAARAVMEASGTVFLAGPGAIKFLRTQPDLEFMGSDYFATERRREALRAELARRAAGGADRRSDADRHGTVGAVARDRAGDLAAATSTGGITGKRAGRIGDTPVIGAGTYADNASCAVSTTGTGEVFIRFSAAAELAARVKYGGQSLDEAAADVVVELAAEGGDGGLIAVGRAGPPVLPFSAAGMYRGFVGEDGVFHTAIHREAYRVAQSV